MNLAAFVAKRAELELVIIFNVTPYFMQNQESNGELLYVGPDIINVTLDSTNL